MCHGGGLIMANEALIWAPTLKRAQRVTNTARLACVHAALLYLLCRSHRDDPWGRQLGGINILCHT